MTRHTTPMRQAFSMIELAIVIVVVGLLLGGLVGIRSYTKNAELNSVINESKYYTNAFNQFQTRYNGAPGDYAHASLAWADCAAATATDSVDHNGDGNGLIRATAGTPNYKEWFYSFQHLTNAGFIQGKYTGISTAAPAYYAKTGTNLPGSSMPTVAFLFDNPDFSDGSPDGFVSGDATYFDGQYSNILIAAALIGTTSMPNQPFLTAAQGLQIDRKFDDGLPGTGNIVTPISTALSNCASTAVATTAVYNTSGGGDNKTCYLILKMM